MGRDRRRPSVERAASFLVKRARDRPHIDLCTGLHRVGNEVELRHRVLQIEVVEHDFRDRRSGLSGEPRSDRSRRRCNRRPRWPDRAKQAITGLCVSARNWRSSSAMMSHVVTLPPALLILRTTAVTCGSRGGRLQLVAECRKRVIADGVHGAVILVHQQAIDVDQGNAGTGLRVAGPDDGGRHLARIAAVGSFKSKEPLTVASASRWRPHFLESGRNRKRVPAAGEPGQRPRQPGRRTQAGRRLCLSRHA